ncbi:hypothetical protein M5K25_008576 [Dendrobium thyrsiflorum]|uniref:Uncharacterized protein n=1 Tax=Dendrobium thyrsiflorum TaxID=117978 RepID=A0ABD0V996_DENTH
MGVSLLRPFLWRVEYTELPAIWPYLGVLDPSSYTHSGFRLELREICFPMLTLLKLVDLSRPFVAEDLEPTGVWIPACSTRMVGEWMMDPIKIPWFRRPESSWSLVYLVRGGSRPNLTEGSSSTAMGFDAIGEHTGAGHNHNIVMPFGGKSPGSEGPES